MTAVWWCKKYCSSYLNQDPQSLPFLSDPCLSSSQLWTAQEVLSTMTELPDVLHVTKFKGLEFMPTSNRVENQRLHIHIFTAGTRWYKSEYWFYQFTSNNQPVHSNHTGCWIKAFFFAEVCTGLCKRALHQGNCFSAATPLFPKMPTQLATPCFISLLLQNATQHRAHWDGREALLNAPALVELGQNAHGWFKSELLWFGILGEGQQLISVRHSFS